MLTTLYRVFYESGFSIWHVVNAVVIIALSIALVVIATDSLLVLCWVFRFRRFEIEKDYEPLISILVAARNEEENLDRCLTSLLSLDYPADKLEILIGNDDSTDGTSLILAEWKAKSQMIQTFDIKTQTGNTKGKANVLAQLAKESKGEFLFITDADCQVGPLWVRSLLGCYEDEVGIGVGVTDVQNIWQGMDWLFALGLIKALHDLDNPVVAMGNNMFVTRKAYDAVGGYESIPFSVTEDLELFKQVKKKGFKTRHIASVESTVLTNSTKGILNLLRQRKRWLAGAVQLHPGIVFLLLVQALYYPAIVLLLFLWTPFGISIFTIKGLIQALIVFKVGNTIRRPKRGLPLILFEFYQLYVALVSSFYFLLPTRVVWKGRKY
ncbi:MAG: glycosyltransferase [Bacteroidota bacterium]